MGEGRFARAPKIALIHDELTRRGGAEIVFEELADLWPQADLFTLYAGQPVLRVNDNLKPVKTSYLQNFPRWWRRHPGRLLALLPHAAEQFDFSDYDLVLSSASGFAKAVITRSTVPHLCYCHTPTRYLWDSTWDVLKQRRFTRWPFAVAAHYLRLVDFAAAQRVDRFIANSEYTRDRIWTYYRRRSDVIYPPVDTDFFRPEGSHEKIVPTERPFLLVGRLTRSKYFDQAIRVAEKLKLPLLVVGSGYDRKRLQRLAGPYTRFMGRLAPAELRHCYRFARALLQPGIEDFGMATVEALACGTPVIAYGLGGAAEIITTEAVGYRYDQEGEEGLAEALRRFLSEGRSWSSEVLHNHAARFSRQQFRTAIYKAVQRALESRPKA